MEMNRIEDIVAENVAVDIEVPEEPSVQLEAPDSAKEIVSGLNEDFMMKQRLYETVLAPELKKNEELKREQKKKLMENIFKILKGQFIATYLFIIIIIIQLTFSSYLKISEALAMEIMSFIKFYITSIIVELISILFFVVKNVFDTSIVDMFKNFDNKSDKKEP